MPPPAAHPAHIPGSLVQEDGQAWPWSRRHSHGGRRTGQHHPEDFQEAVWPSLAAARTRNLGMPPRVAGKIAAPVSTPVSCVRHSQTDSDEYRLIAMFRCLRWAYVTVTTQSIILKRMSNGAVAKVKLICLRCRHADPAVPIRGYEQYESSLRVCPCRHACTCV